MSEALFTGIALRGPDSRVGGPGRYEVPGAGRSGAPTGVPGARGALFVGPREVRMSWLLLMAQPAGGGAQTNPIIGFLPVVFLIVIFYFLLIRPQQKRAKQ